MALNIEGASIGYNSDEVETAINNLHAECIEETKALMNKELDTLRNAVDNAWVGQSAETFKKNLQSDVVSIGESLDSTFEALKREMYAIVNNMDTVDQMLVKERGAE